MIAYLTPVASGDQSSPPKPQVFDGPRFPFLDVIRALERANLALFEPAKLLRPVLCNGGRRYRDEGEERKNRCHRAGPFLFFKLLEQQEKGQCR